VLSSPHTAINDPVSWLLHSCVSSTIAHSPVGLPNLCMLALVYLSKKTDAFILSQNESLVHFKPPLRSWIHSRGHLQFDFSRSDNYPVKALTHSVGEKASWKVKTKKFFFFFLHTHTNTLCEVYCASCHKRYHSAMKEPLPVNSETIYSDTFWHIVNKHANRFDPIHQMNYPFSR